MTDDKWRRRGKILQARIEQAKLRLSATVDLLRVKRLEWEIRYLTWKIDKLDTLNELAESKAYQYGWDDE